jgi:hypothetical protein
MASNWTMLVYMAGDNNLESAGVSDLEEMQKVGSNDNVNVIVQFDTEENKTTRYRVEKGKLDTLQEMPGVDCGDPKVLTDFLKWGITNYPADHYLVDVWNHGGGWENLPANYNYDNIRAAKPQNAARLMHVKRSVFRTTVKKINDLPEEKRAIAVDCGSQDYLDNQELRRAFEDAMPGGKKFDIFACDACLMNMVEIAYEMRNTADFMVGSEQTEPGAGWPYDAILGKLVAKPTMAPEELAKLVVVEYGKSYEGSGESATQSALNLNSMGPVVKSIDALSSVLLNNLNSVAGGISLARDKSQKFEMPEYIDLADFVAQLSKRISGSKDVKAATDNVQSALDGGFVVKNAAIGNGVERANGVSIYFPSKEDYAPDYKDLLLSSDCKWNQFLNGFFEA